MTKDLRRWLLTAVLVAATGAGLMAQASSPLLGRQPFAWWKSEPFKQELRLTTDQASRIDQIWETTRPELRQEWEELRKLEGKLSRLLQNDANEAILARQIDRVETARANANKTRSLMLVQMIKVLSPEQRARFKELHERWQNEDQRRTPAPSNPQR